MNENTKKTEKKTEKISEKIILPTGTVVNTPSPITVLKLSDNIEPLTKEIYFRPNTTAGIVYYLYTLYGGKGEAKGDPIGISNKISGRVLDLIREVKNAEENPFISSKNSAGRTPRIISRIRELVRMGGKIKETEKISLSLGEKVRAFLTAK